MSKYTLRYETQIDLDIKKDLSIIIDAIQKTGIQYHAIYLIGGFGRGEGTVSFNGIKWLAVNDYDLVVITDNCSKITPILNILSHKLARRVQTDFVDLGCLNRDSLNQLPHTMQNYDLKYGSFLLAGDDCRNEIPDYKHGSIPSFELVRLICNRSAGLLIAKLPENCNSIQYIRNQYIKACIAVGDILVYLTYGYHHLYSHRYKMFRECAQNTTLPIMLDSNAINAIDKAYYAKLYGSSFTSFPIPEQQMQGMIKQAYIAITQHICPTKNTLFHANSTLVKYYTINNKNAEKIHNHFNWSEKIKKCLRYRKIFNKSDRYYKVLFSQPLFYCFPKNRLISQALYLMIFLSIPHALYQPWNKLSAVRLWEHYCH